MSKEKIFISYADNKQRSDEELEKDRAFVKEFLEQQDKRREQKNIDAIKNHIESLENRLQYTQEKNIEYINENVYLKEKIKSVKNYCDNQTEFSSNYVILALSITSFIFFVYSFFSGGENRFVSQLFSMLLLYAVADIYSKRKLLENIFKVIK